MSEFIVGLILEHERQIHLKGNRLLHHRIFAGLLGLCIAALLISTVALVLGSLTKETSVSPSSLPTKAAPLDLTTVISSYIKSNGKLTPKLLAVLERPYITFIGDTLAPSDDKLTGTLEVIIPPGVPPFISTASGKSVFNCAGASCTPYPQYAHESVDATMLVTNAGSNYEQHELIPFGDFFSTSVLGLHEFPVTIPVKGYAGSYPQDTYSADVSLALDFPGGFKPSFQTGAHEQVRTVEGGTVSNTYEVSTAPTPASYQSVVSNDDDTFVIRIGRSWYDQFFVFTVALIPTLFALLFLHLLFFSGGRGGGPYFEHFTEALIVAILSVLPLRAVLVPGDISGLTRVDLTLAVGLVLIVAVSAGKYVDEIWSRKHPITELAHAHEHVQVELEEAEPEVSSDVAPQPAGE